MAVTNGTANFLASVMKLLTAKNEIPLNLDIERAGELMNNLGRLWVHKGVTLEEKRELAQEVFDEVRMREKKLVAVAPADAYNRYSR